MSKLIRQNTEAWYQARCGKFTASCFGDIMTRPLDKSQPFSKTAENYIRRKALELKRGKPLPLDKNFAPIRWGQKYEPEALEAFNQRTKLNVREGGLLFHPKWPDIGATPDALIVDEFGEALLATVQVKCPYKTHNHLKYCEKIHDAASLKKVAKQYYWQMLGEMWVFGVQSSYFVSYDPRLPAGEDLHSVFVSLNEDDLLQLSVGLLKAIQLRDQLL